MKSTKILITSFTYPPQQNGVSHVVEAIATGLAARGHDITVTTGTHEQSPHQDLCQGVRIRRFDVAGNGMSIRGCYRGDIGGYQNFIDAFDGDVIFCHCWQIWSTDLALPVLPYPANKIFVSHGVSATRLTWSPKGLLNRLLWEPYIRRMPLMLQCFDHVVLLSNQCKGFGFYDRRLLNHLMRPGYTIIPNGANMMNFSDRQQQSTIFRHNYGITGKLVLYVANYSSLKNQELAIKVFLEVAEREDVLVFVGTEVNDYSRGLVQRYEQRMNTESGGRVLFLEKLEPAMLAAAYCASDVFLCTSKIEVQPLVLLDAMAAGTPFLSTDVGCVRELPGGMVAANRREMVVILRRLLEDRNLRRSLSQAGQTASRDHYTWPRVLDRYEELISRVCQ